jgi:hypothetical protein
MFTKASYSLILILISINYYIITFSAGTSFLISFYFLVPTIFFFNTNLKAVLKLDNTISSIANSSFKSRNITTLDST